MLLAVLGCSGLYWAVQGDTELYSAVLGCTGLYWDVLGYTCLYWAGSPAVNFNFKMLSAYIPYPFLRHANRI